jgi:tetratricopeptide (TPR) repeat protein
MASEVNTAVSTATRGPSSSNDRASRWRGVAARVVRGGGWVLVLTLITLNVWWLWRDARPVADLKTAARWVTEGRFDDADWALREQLRRSPHDGEAMMLLARLLAQRGDGLGCARTLHGIPDWYPDKGKMLFLEGQAFKSLDRRADAEIAWKKLTVTDPLHPFPEEYVAKAVLELMELCAMEERWEEAHALLWKSYDRADPSERPRFLVMKMRTELERVLPAKAAVTLRRLVEAMPSDWEASFALSRAERSAGQEPEAARLLDQCLKQRPEDPRGWREWLSILHNKGENDGLAVALARVPAAVGNDPEVMKYRAGALERKQDWAAATGLYRRMVEAQPFNAEYLYRLAAAEQRIGERDKAQEHRSRSRNIRAARTDLGQAFQNYLDVSRAAESDPKALATAVSKISTLCEALGWSRDAKAWALLAPVD